MQVLKKEINPNIFFRQEKYTTCLTTFIHKDHSGKKKCKRRRVVLRKCIFLIPFLPKMDISLLIGQEEQLREAEKKVLLLMAPPPPSLMADGT